MSSSPKVAPPAAIAFTSAEALAAALGVELCPSPKPNEVRRLRMALPGYAALLDDIAELLARDGEALGVRDVDPDGLIAMQRRYRRLRALEVVLEAVYLSVYYQRLRLDDEAMGLLQRLVRRVRSRAEEDPELPRRWRVLLDFMGAFRKGGRPGGSAAPSGAPSSDGEGLG
ncbi:MAG TPA: hypothetical protein VFS43_42615 [Polyangiaceae bacterium]|nr:hypothetical protein [Polyangiaceae bacterium]